METTFITIHDLSSEGRILYASDSVVDILGYTPDEVLHRSCWDFFHPEELPFARNLHSRGVKLDKAAMLSYCLLRNRQSQWVCCECCFTIVYDVMVVCTSIYRRGIVSEARAAQAPVIRRLFSSSPKDPRYHMLSHLSGKFGQTEQQQTHEPRAALFLNRFTRTLTVMYATAGVEKILGISGEEMKGKSFYYCIQENCLDDAVRCLESAKANDSIAYLRFMFRDPRIEDPSEPGAETSTETETDDMSMTDGTSDSSDSEWEGEPGPQTSQGPVSTTSHGSTSASGSAVTDAPAAQLHVMSPTADSALSDTEMTVSSSGAGSLSSHQPSSTSGIASPESTASTARHAGNPGIELEAVISCTSDGLVVCLRRARPMVPAGVQPPAARQPVHTSGVFAAPWATTPVFYPPKPDYQYWPIQAYGPAQAPVPGTHAPHLGGMATAPQGPSAQALFETIRDTAIFAWALTGINGSLAECATNPKASIGESQPPDGLPVWDGANKAYGDGYFQQRGSHSGSGSDSGYASVGQGTGSGTGQRHDSASGGPNPS